MDSRSFLHTRTVWLGSPGDSEATPSEATAAGAFPFHLHGHSFNTCVRCRIVSLDPRPSHSVFSKLWRELEKRMSADIALDGVDPLHVIEWAMRYFLRA
jgi:hypothetical protein